MKYSNLSHLSWLIPIMLGFLLSQQLLVYYGIQQTFETGEQITANITDFRIKQIAAQTNGYVDLQFVDSQGNEIAQRLGLHVQHASQLIGSNEVAIKYLPSTSYDIVIVDTYEYHKSTVLINIAVILFSLVVLVPVCVFASRYALRKQSSARAGGRQELQFEYSNQTIK